MKTPMSYSLTGVQLTESFEGCKLIPYRDTGGIWTDGYGNTHGVVPGTAITQAKAEADLIRNVQSAVDTVNRLVTVQLTQPEFDAIVDFVFNCGAGTFAKSTLLRDMNSSNFGDAANQFERWDMAAGQHVAGLLRRRLAEKQEFQETA